MFASVAFQTLNDDEEVFKGNMPVVKGKGEATNWKADGKVLSDLAKLKKSETKADIGENSNYQMALPAETGKVSILTNTK